MESEQTPPLFLRYILKKSGYYNSQLAGTSPNGEESSKTETVMKIYHDKLSKGGSIDKPTINQTHDRFAAIASECETYIQILNTFNLSATKALKKFESEKVKDPLDIKKINSFLATAKTLDLNYAPLQLGTILKEVIQTTEANISKYQQQIISGEMRESIDEAAAEPPPREVDSDFSPRQSLDTNPTNPFVNTSDKT